jgi:hypothetical protein
MGNEGLLQRVQLSVGRQPFDGRDFGAIFHDGKSQARDDTPPIHQHRARPALAVVATLLRSGEIEIFTQRIVKGGPGSDRKFPLFFPVIRGTWLQRHVRCSLSAQPA